MLAVSTTKHLSDKLEALRRTLLHTAKRPSVREKENARVLPKKELQNNAQKPLSVRPALSIATYILAL